MPSEVQLALVVAIVALAVGYLAYRGWLTWRASRAGCAGGCGCAKPEAPAPKGLIAPDELLQRRK